MHDEYKDTSDFGSQKQDQTSVDHVSVSADKGQIAFAINCIIAGNSVKENFEFISANLINTDLFLEEFNNPQFFNCVMEIIANNAFECGILCLKTVQQIIKLPGAADSIFNNEDLISMLIHLFNTIDDQELEVRWEIVNLFYIFSKISKDNIEILINLGCFESINKLWLSSDNIDLIERVLDLLIEFCDQYFDLIVFQLLQFIPHIYYSIVDANLNIRQKSLNILRKMLFNPILFQKCCELDMQNQLIEAAKCDLPKNDENLFTCVYYFIENGFQNCFAADSFINTLYWRIHNYRHQDILYNIRTSILIIYKLTDKFSELLESHKIYEELVDVFFKSEIFENRLWSIKTLYKYLNLCDYDFVIQYCDRLIPDTIEFLESVDDFGLIDILTVFNKLLTNTPEVYVQRMLDTEAPDAVDSLEPSELDIIDQAIDQFLSFFEKQES